MRVHLPLNYPLHNAYDIIKPRHLSTFTGKEEMIKVEKIYKNMTI